METSCLYPVIYLFI
uniref:Uncharacterized protein n=1 Tax=Anguilla anguilla TaxID=7936 RepID=A0A0E9UNP2_ANGAN